MTTWHTDYTREGFEPPNPLCVGEHCPECGTRLEKREGEIRDCPMGCER